MFKGKNKNDQLEESLLRSIIIYRSACRSDKRTEFIAVAILGVIAATGKCTPSQITETLNNRFKLQLTASEIQKHAEKLHKNNLIKIIGDEYCIPTDKSDSLILRIKNSTDLLLNGVVERIERSGVSVDDRSKSQLIKNAEKALSTYYHYFGYSFVGLQTRSTDLVPDAIKTAKTNLSSRQADALIRALSDLLQNPSDDERTELEMWAKSFVTLELLNLDPLLRNFRYTKLRDKKFVIDTDVALHCLTSDAKYSRNYKMMINRLREDAGCLFIIPAKVIDEIATHHHQAPGHYRRYGSSVDNLTDELLENQNVFLEDFVKIRRHNPELQDMSFDTYLNNICDPRHPNFLRNKLLEIFGEKTEIWPDERLAGIDTAERRDLACMIKALTEKQEKGERRRDEHNEQIANVDAQLYLTIKQINDSEKDNGYALSHKIYLLTQSRKIKYAVEEKIGGRGATSCICSPAAMIAVLNELGRTGGQDISYINLFENPFLPYTAEKVWEQIEPVIKRNIELKHVDLERMRLDVETDFDRLLTSRNTNEIEKAGKLFAIKGYTFADEFLKLPADMRQREELIAAQSEEIKNLRKENEILRKEKRKKDYLNRISTKYVAPRRRKGK